MLTYDSDTAETTALAVINGGGPAGYPFDSGLYLFPDNEQHLEYEPPIAEDDDNATVVIPGRLTDEEESELGKISDLLLIRSSLILIFL